MRACRSIALRIAALLAALSLAATRTHATDASSTPTPTGGLDQAKSEYDAIKTARSSQEQQKLAVPVVPPLELKLDDIPFAPAGLNPNDRDHSKSATARKSQNWLLDAMDDAKKKSAHREGESKDAVKAFGESDAASVEEDRTGSSSRFDLTAAPTKDPRDNRKLGPTAPDVVNPLASYMSSWMSAGDLALLAPKSKNESNALSGLAPTGQVAGTSAVSDPAALFDSSPSTDRSATPLKEETNPYLAPLTLPPPPSFAPSPSLPLTPVVTPIPTPSPLPEPARAPSPAEQFRNSRDDEKLFKPLKRF